MRCVCEAERGWGQKMGIADFRRLLEGAGSSNGARRGTARVSTGTQRPALQCRSSEAAAMATEVQSREEDDEETGLGCTHQHQHQYPASTFGISSRPIEGPRTKDQGGLRRRVVQDGWMDGWMDGWIGKRSDLQRRPSWGSGRARQGKVRFRIGLTDERTTYSTD